MVFSISFVLTGALGVNGVPGQTWAGHSARMFPGSLAAKRPLLPAALPMLTAALLSHQRQQLPRASLRHVPMPRSPCHAPAPRPDPAAELARAAPHRTRATPHRTRATHRVHASSTKPIPVEFPCPALRLPALTDTGVSLLPWPCPCSLRSLQRVTKKSPRLVPGGSWRAGL